jgi:hypothetical protein
MVAAVGKGRGGARPGAGRRKDQAKDIKAGPASALRILNALGDPKAIDKLSGHEQVLATLFSTWTDARTRAMIIFRLRDMAFGKPSQALSSRGRWTPPMKIEVEFIGGDV